MRYILIAEIWISEFWITRMRQEIFDQMSKVEFHISRLRNMENRRQFSLWSFR